MRVALPIRRKRKSRVLLVPNQWSGSVQEYYHFLLGYVGPVLVWLERHPGKQFAIRDCGPMQPWIEALLAGEDYQILNPGAMLHLFAGKTHKAQVLRGFDDPFAFRKPDLLAFRSLALRRLGIEVSAPLSVTVIDRASSGEFNATLAAEVPASGAAVRSVPNLRACVEQTGLDVDRVVVDAAHMSPRDQVDLFASTSILIGQHGAGLANMLWMPEGSTVVEILPPSPPWVEPIFANLATTLGHRHIAVPQSDSHAEINLADFVAAVRQAQGGPA